MSWALRRYNYKVISSIFPERKLLLLYICHSFRTWGDRIWNFSIPLLFSDIYPNSLAWTGLFTLSSAIVVFFVAPKVGNLVDKNNRLAVMFSSITVSNLCIALEGNLIAFLGLYSRGYSSPFETSITGAAFIACLSLAPLISLSTLISSVSIERDWAIVITGNKEQLTTTNATIKRITLVAEIVAPILFSSISTVTDHIICALIIPLWYVISYMIEITILLNLYATEPKLSIKNKKPETFGLLKGWVEYFKQIVLFPSLAYCMLYINVLSPSQMMLVFLKANHVPDFFVGLFRATSAVSGVMMTFITPYFIKKIGIVIGGVVSLWFQWTTCMVGIACFYLLEHGYSIYVFCGWIVISRLGKWSYDMCQVQIMQVGVAEEKRGLIGSTEKALCNLLYMAIVLLAVVLDKPENFVYIMGISSCSLFLAAAGYTIWMFLILSVWKIFFNIWEGKTTSSTVDL